MSVLRTCVTKQTKDLRYRDVESLWFLPLVLRTMMRYALERESYRGATSAISIELPKGRNVCFRALSRVLNNATPGGVYQPSSVLLHRNPIEFVYPHGFMLRRVNNSGDISWHKGRVFISEVFRFEILGFEQVDEDFYKVYFRDVEIGEF